MTLRARHIVLAALLHVALFSLLVTGVRCSQKVETPPVIQGVLINPAQVPKPAAVPPKPQPQVEAPVQDLQAQRQAEQQQQQQQALQRQLQEQARQQAEQQKLQAQQEAQRKAEELKKQQEAEAQRKAEEEKQAEAQRQEQLRKQAEAEAQARKALEEKKKAELARQQAQRLAELQQQLGIEAGQLQQQLQNEWVTQIQAALHRAFVSPPGVSNTLSCKISIQLAPTGAVQSASIVNSSGNTLFDNSVLSAVYKASPLPLPRDPSLFQPSLVVNFVP